MKGNKKERRVDNLDIKAFVKKVFQESSRLMAKLAASPEDEGECFVDIARSISIKRLNELYGDLVDVRIVERLNNEIDEFNGIGQIENILKLSDMLHKKMNKGTLIIPRLTVGNSLLLFLLEITNVNPLPRHHYCPKCHTFHWAHKQSDYCECCGEPVVEDGYDLDYQLLIDDIKRLKHPFQFSTSGKKLEEEGIICGYHTLINWDKTSIDKVSALIEVKVTPQPRRGFDAIAEEIYRLEEVKAVYLMSGTYDLAITLESKTMRDVSLFVSERLAPIDAVISTATHFIMKQYKEGGVILDNGEVSGRLPVHE